MPGPVRLDDPGLVDVDPIVVVALCRPNGPPSLHLGIRYRDQGQVHHLHLGWEDYLSRNWSWPGVGALPSADDSRLKSAAAKCRQIWRRFETDRKMPYGLAWRGSRFTASGVLELAPGARGLTCATFVLAVLKSVGIELVAEDTWPDRLEETDEFITRVGGDPPSPIAEGMRQELVSGARRITPDEVVGACLVEPLPATFAAASAAAREVVNLLDAA